MKYLLVALTSLIACSAGDKTNTPITPTNQEFNDYWYQGKAEVSSYKLQQARYGEMRDGYVVLVFVTEDYSLKNHLKVNDVAKAGNDLVKILKLNTDKKYNTGIYQYAMMQSAFTPINLNKHPNTLRVTTSSQEWCGHTFDMLDLDGDKYKRSLHSYFENEGDQEEKLGKALLEDEIWTRLRIDYKSLPMGEIKVIPSSMAARLSHRPLAVENATASLLAHKDELVYSVHYNDFERELVIHFADDFPHQILGWEETYLSGFGDGAKKLSTKATLNKTMITDYWSKNHNSDSGLRKELGLED